MMPERIDLPISTGDLKGDLELCLKFINELQPTGQSIGSLQARMRQCRRTDTETFRDYEARLIIFEHNMIEMVSFLRMVLTRCKETQSLVD